MTNKLARTVSNTDIAWFLTNNSLDNHKPLNVKLNNQLADVVSNSNEVIPNKVKPSVDTSINNDVELDLMDKRKLRDRSKTEGSLYPTKSASATISSNNGSGGLFGKFKSKFNSSSNSNKPSKESSPALRSSIDSPPLSVIASGPPSANNSSNSLSRSVSTPSYGGSVDPKLEEYIAFYKTQFNNSLSKTFTNDSSSSQISSNGPKLDSSGRPIPAHPSFCPLPSILLNKFEECNIKVEAPKSKLSFLSRKKSIEPSTPKRNSIAESAARRASIAIVETRRTSESGPSAPPKSRRNSVGESLRRTSTATESSTLTLVDSNSTSSNMDPQLKLPKKVKKVGFASSVFAIDPPQQIPSRNPRKGNVEVSKGGGSLTIHPLSEDDIKRIQQNSGLIVGGTGHLKLKSRIEGEKTKEQQIAEKTDESESKEPSPDSADVKVDSKAKELDIDKPMMKKTRSSATLNIDIEHLTADDVPLDVIYTRICHLREILPIPATQKQIPHTVNQPVHSLQLRNPRPSLIEVLTFSDFTRVAPVLCITLDGLQLSADMLRILLVNAPKAEKISLRNTHLDEEGWKLLCWYLSYNKTLNRLDLTQVESLTINTQKVSSKPSSIERMNSNSDNRSDMDWDIFIAAMIARGGLEELVLNGCKIPFPQFKELVTRALIGNTVLLGMAYNELTLKHHEILAQWIKHDNSRGLDLGYNDLSGCLGPYIELAKENHISNLAFLSLNCANLSYDDQLLVFLAAFVNVPSLQYFDLSNNKRVFPQIVPILTTYLPSFPQLRRLHLNYNELSTESIVKIAEIIPFCYKLSCLGLIGNHLDNKAVVSLIAGLKNSKSLITLDINYDEISSKLQKDIGLLTMKNMDTLFDGEKSLTDRLIRLVSKGELDYKDPTVVKVIKDAMNIKKKIHESINELFNLQISGRLNIEGKETLIRFCFIENSLTKGLELIDPRLNQDTFEIPFQVKASTTGTIDNLNEEPTETLLDVVSPILSRAGSSTSLRKQQMEEGSMLKLSKFSTTKSFQDLMDLSGEEIRNKLLTSDIQKVVDYLNRLKNEGIGLDTIYNKKKSSDCLQLEKLRRVFNQSERKSPDEDDNDTEDSINSDDEEVSAVYDKLLDDLVKVKTKE